MRRTIRTAAGAAALAAACALLQGCTLTEQGRAEHLATDRVHARFDAYRGRVERAAAGAEPLSRAITAGAHDVRGSSLQNPFSGTVVLYASAQSGGGLAASSVGAIGCVHLDVRRGGEAHWRHADCPDGIRTPPGNPRPTLEVDLP